MALGCICWLLWTSILFFVLSCSQIIQQWRFLQCSECIKISRDFRRCPKKPGEFRLSSVLSLSCGRSCGLGNLLGSEERGDTSKLRLLFLPFQCGWPYILWFMECWNLSTGFQSSHKDIFVCGWLSNQCFCGGIRAGTSYFAILLISLPLSMYSCNTQPLEQNPTLLTAQGAWGVWSHSLFHLPQLHYNLFIMHYCASKQYECLHKWGHFINKLSYLLLLIKEAAHNAPGAPVCLRKFVNWISDLTRLTTAANSRISLFMPINALRGFNSRSWWWE